MVFPQGNTGLVITVIVVLLAVVDTWFDGLWISVGFGAAHVITVRTMWYFMEDLCCERSG
jgi:hypothetical protein